jgi:uncharacterized phage infection (PIP) family protein YhgE
MKKAQLFIVFAAALTLFAFSADAQKRTTKRPTPKPLPTPIVPLDVKAAKEKVGNQISNVTQFTNKLGPIAAGIESVDKDAKTKKLKKSDLDANEANKQKVKKAISNLRGGLTSLETEFRTKPMLRKYLLNIDGITLLATQSEDAALAGRFTDSRKPLLTVLQKLSDTFAAMPK